MDLWSILIILSVFVSTIVMIVGPLMETRGKILFDKEKPPKVKGRFGMGIMVISMVFFIGGLFLRQVMESEIITVLVLGGYFLWFIGGIIAVSRNEVLKFMIQKTSARRSK